MGTLLLAVLVLVLLRTLPAWPHSRDWGFRPSAGVGLVLAGVVVLLLLGYIPR